LKGGIKMSKIDELQEGLDELKDAMEQTIEKAQELYSISSEFRCFGGQLDAYLIGHLKSFLNNSHQPGSIASLQEMLDDDEECYDDEEEEDEE
jgi:hypothetical protein